MIFQLLVSALLLTFGLPPVHGNRNVSSINTLTRLSQNGEYVGDTRTRVSKEGKRSPIYNQRTSFLYYLRKQVGHSLIWSTLSMGVFEHLNEILLDKKDSFEFWMNTDPEKYSKIVDNVPKTWHDTSTDFDDIDKDSIYVFKPSATFGGAGILFIEGGQVENVVDEHKGESWVIQEYVEPYLYNDKKTHFRALTMAVVQPDGTYEYFMYSKMKMFLAPLDYERDYLFDRNFMDSDMSHYMLATNLMANKEYYKETYVPGSKRFNPWDVVLDLETSVGSETFENVYLKTRDIHETVYDIAGKYLTCVETDVSIYSKSCFYIFASDMAMDKNGDVFLLEINGGMGIFGVFKDHETREFADSAVAHLNLPDIPFEVKDDLNLWESI